MTTTALSIARPISFAPTLVRKILDGRKSQTRRLISPQPDLLGTSDGDLPVAFCAGKLIPCRCGAPGDTLWVREKWAYRSQVNSLFSGDGSEVVYAADTASESFAVTGWKPARFMPQRCSRLQLRVEALRIERLNNISVADALAEGFEQTSSALDPIEWFAGLWDSLADAEAQWANNPLVWVIVFSTITNSVR